MKLCAMIVYGVIAVSMAAVILLFYCLKSSVQLDTPPPILKNLKIFLNFSGKIFFQWSPPCVETALHLMSPQKDETAFMSSLLLILL